jgi:hypothetical protein
MCRLLGWRNVIICPKNLLVHTNIGVRSGICCIYLLTQVVKKNTKPVYSRKHCVSKHIPTATYYCLRIQAEILHDFRFPLLCKWDLCPSDMLRTVDWYLLADVSGMLDPWRWNPIGFPETLVNKYQSMIRKFWEERRPQLISCYIKCRTLTCLNPV